MQRICSNCNQLHPQGIRCPETQRHLERQRAATKQPRARGRYDYAWRKIAAWVVATEGRCRTCGHTGSKDNPLTADHIIALAAGGARLDPSNLQCLCRRHNSSKNAKR